MYVYVWYVLYIDIQYIQDMQYSQTSSITSPLLPQFTYHEHQSIVHNIILSYVCPVHSYLSLHRTI